MNILVNRCEKYQIDILLMNKTNTKQIASNVNKMN